MWLNFLKWRTWIFVFTHTVSVYPAFPSSVESSPCVTTSRPPPNQFALRESVMVSPYHMEMSLYIMIQLTTEAHPSLLHLTVPSHVRQKYPTV